MLVAGLDYWFKKSAPNGTLVDCENKGEFDVFEPRISRILDVGKFRRPPDYRAVRQGERSPPPNANLHVPAFRFPTWYRHTRTARLKKFELNNAGLPPAQGGRWNWCPGEPDRHQVATSINAPTRNVWSVKNPCRMS